MILSVLSCCNRLIIMTSVSTKFRGHPSDWNMIFFLLGTARNRDRRARAKWRCCWNKLVAGKKEFRWTLPVGWNGLVHVWKSFLIIGFCRNLGLDRCQWCDHRRSFGARNKWFAQQYARMFGLLNKWCGKCFLLFGWNTIEVEQIEILLFHGASML